MFSSIGSPSIMFDRIGAAVERMAQYKAILRMLPRVCLISTRTFPVISCMAFCAAALAGKSPPSRGENNRGALSAIGKRLPIIDGRSEEHTSELQSLMRISYAVFCLKKKNTTHHTNTKLENNAQQSNTTHIS